MMQTRARERHRRWRKSDAGKETAGAERHKVHRAGL